jgi:hypothetical protein
MFYGSLNVTFANARSKESKYLMIISVTHVQVLKKIVAVSFAQFVITKRLTRTDCDNTRVAIRGSRGFRCQLCNTWYPQAANLIAQNKRN